MRLIPALMLVTSALSLAACGGGGAGGSLLATGIENNAIACAIPEVDNTLDANCKTIVEVPVVSTGPDADGDGVTDKDDTDGSTGSGAGGNTESMDTGNKAILLQGFIYDTPTDGTALVALDAPGNASSQAASDALFLGASKPKTIRHRVDAKSANNTKLATAVIQEEYKAGTQDLDWIGLGHHTIDLGNLSITQSRNIIGTNGATVVSYAGYPVLLGKDGARNIVYDPTDKKYKVATRNTNPDPDNDTRTPMPDWIWGATVDASEDHYWNQVAANMTSKANGGAGAGYREYRVLSESETDKRDELLQLWAFGDSYATQYQNASGGGLPKHQVWSFGGRKAQNVPTTGSATFNGRWVAAAKTENWLKPDSAAIDPNALWRVEGNSQFAVNYDTGNIRGTLNPETWTSFQDKIGAYTWFAADSGRKSNGTAQQPDYSIIYETRVNIDANMDTAVAGQPRNTFTGEADLSGTYITGSNPVHGGFFGTNGTELTGVFNAAGLNPNPQGGSQGVNDNRRGVLRINGAFNADCVPNVTCAP
jgi:C-lobe and N-lobe beta barrels of Tf-binding protein B